MSQVVIENPRLIMPKSEKKLRVRDAKRELGQELLHSVREMKAGHRGHVHKRRFSFSAQASVKILGVNLA